MNGSECRNLNELAAESRGNGNLAHGKGFEQEAEASRFHKECLDRSQVRDRQQPSWSSCSWQNATIYSGLQAEARTLSHCWVLPRQTDTLSGAVLCGRRIFFRAGARTWCPKADLPSAPVFCPPWMYQVQCTKHWAHPTTLPSVPTTVPTPSSQSSTQAIIIPRPPTHPRVGHLIIKQSTLVPKYRRGWFDCRWWSRRTQQGPDVNIDQLQAIILLSGRTEAQADKNTKDWTNWFLTKGCTAAWRTFWSGPLKHIWWFWHTFTFMPWCQRQKGQKWSCDGWHWQGLCYGFEANRL